MVERKWIGNVGNKPICRSCRHIRRDSESLGGGSYKHRRTYFTCKLVFGGIGGKVGFHDKCPSYEVAEEVIATSSEAKNIYK